MYKFWNFARKFVEKNKIPGVEQVEEKLFNLLSSAECIGEESYIAKWERRSKIIMVSG